MEAVTLLWGSDYCFGAFTKLWLWLLLRTWNAYGHNKFKQRSQLESHWIIVCLYQRGCLTRVKSKRDFCLETSSWPDFFSPAMYIRNVVIKWRCLSFAVLCISLKKKCSIKNSTQRGWGKGTGKIYIIRETTELPQLKLALIIPSYKEQIMSLICVNIRRGRKWTNADRN